MPDTVTPPPAPSTETPPPVSKPDWQSLIVKGLEAVAAPPPDAKESQSAPPITLGEIARAASERTAAKAEEAAKLAADESATNRQPDGTTPPPPSSAPAKPKLEVTKTVPLEEQVQAILAKNTPKPAETKSEVPATVPATVAAEKEYEEKLDDVAKEELQLARFAEQSKPDKYKGMAAKLVGFYKELDAYIDQAQRESPDRTLDENDEVFVKWVEEHKPEYDGSDRRKLERQMVLDEADKRVEQRLKASEEKMTREVAAMKLAPLVKNAADAFVVKAAARMSPDDKSPFAVVTKIAVDKGWDAALAEDPGTAQIAKTYAEMGRDYLKEYLELALQVKPVAVYDPSKSPDHPENQRAITDQKLIRFVNDSEADFNRNGGELKTIKAPDGRTLQFLPREEFNKLSEADRAKHWTLSLEDITDTMAVWSAQAANAAYQAEIKRLEKMGYVKAPKKTETKTENTAPAVTPPTNASPKATSTPASGPSTNSSGPDSPSTWVSHLLKVRNIT